MKIISRLNKPVIVRTIRHQVHFSNHNNSNQTKKKKQEISIMWRSLPYFIKTLIFGFNLNFKRTISTDISSKLNIKSEDTNNLELNIIWFDGEMTGLDVQKHTLIEAAIIITDGNLNILAKSPNIIIHQSEDVLDKMEDWPIQYYSLSGLTESVRRSNISLEQADQMLYEFIKPFTPKGKCPLAGNAINMRKLFILKYMPKLASHLHHRVIDVNTFEELLKRWNPKLFKEAPKKTRMNRALYDIKESVEELQFFKNYLKL